MTIAGISDSLPSVTTASQPCPICHSTARVNRGECLSCLLRTGVEVEEDAGAEDDFDAVLAAIDIRDSDWRLGNYQILEEIGRGGMGVIYRARQRHSKRIVALKRVLSYHADSLETLERFRREAEAAASLDHPNILPIHDVGEADGLPFFTMKYATGGTLQQAAPILSDNPRECVRLMAKITRAVAYAHREGILHRDLKPGNILLDARREPMVSDFGLAKWIDVHTDLTRSLAIFGTPGFIAPEQANGDRAALTPAADVYSLGAILFDLLTGRPPFLGDHALAVIRQAAEKPAPRLRSLKRSLDRDLETICAKCLEREALLRYRSAGALAEDLERWLEGRPIIARPVAPTTRFWRWGKRNPLLVAVSLLCLAAAAMAAMRQLQSARMQKEIAARIAAEHSVEILPILDLDTAEPSPQLALELAKELRQRLATYGPATITVASTKQAQDAPPRTLLVGTTRIVSDKRRVSLHLLDATDEAPLLHDMIEAPDGRLNHAAAREISRRAYEILSLPDLKSAMAAARDPGLLDPEAKSFIDQGMELAKRAGGLDLERSVACLQHAIELQPNSSTAHAGLGKALALQAMYSTTAEPVSLGLDHARRAVALDGGNAEAHLALAAILLQAGRINEATEEAFTSLEYSPTTMRAVHLLVNANKKIGRPDKALSWLNVAARRERGSARHEPAVADCLTYLVDDAAAEKIYQHHRKLHPEQPEGWMGISRLRLLNGRFDEARAICQQERRGYSDFAYAAQMTAEVEFFARNFPEAEKLYAELQQRDPAGGGNFYGAVSYSSALARIRMERDRAAAIALLEKAEAEEIARLDVRNEDPETRYRLAAIAATRGENSRALEDLGHAVELGLLDYRSLEIDPRFDSVRREPRYTDLINSMMQRVAQLRNAAPKGESDDQKEPDI